MKGGFNMQGLMKQAQKMQEKMQKAQEEMKDKTIEATVGGGIVKVVFNGAQELVSIQINKEAVDPDAGISKSKEMVQEEMGAITGGMNIPGMF